MGRTNEKLWSASKAKAKAKMGGKHSARAMQLAGKLYKAAGGKYTGGKTTSQPSYPEPRHGRTVIYTIHTGDDNGSCEPRRHANTTTSRKIQL